MFHVSVCVSQILQWTSTNKGKPTIWLVVYRQSWTREENLFQNTINRSMETTRLFLSDVHFCTKISAVRKTQLKLYFACRTRYTITEISKGITRMTFYSLRHNSVITSAVPTECSSVHKSDFTDFYSSITNVLNNSNLTWRKNENDKYVQFFSSASTLYSLHARKPSSE